MMVVKHISVEHVKQVLSEFEKDDSFHFMNSFAPKGLDVSHFECSEVDVFNDEQDHGEFHAVFHPFALLTDIFSDRFCWTCLCCGVTTNTRDGN